jgi:hypothetical protein
VEALAKEHALGKAAADIGKAKKSAQGLQIDIGHYEVLLSNERTTGQR